MNADLKKSVETVLKLAIKEDRVKEDATTRLVTNSSKVSVGIFFKEDGILCGNKILNHIIKKIDENIKIKWGYKEGDRVKKGSLVAIVQGPGNRIIAYERILLNFIQKLSGVATLTKSFVDTLANKKIQILDTRKTTPGWRHLEKYAVVVGGGKNHRMNLAESILIKDNHIKFCEGIEVVLDKIEKSKTNLRIEVEVSSLNELEKIVKFNINQIMLDNFKIREISKAIRMIRSTSKAKIELSGNIKQKDLKSLSSYDIDFISIGKLTHSAPFLDISMNVLR
tara:strand:- start:1567 stop:2409 length:843 start_codon:yes stop_codon:yes gene_type:complete